jgi:hypothetical protein
VSTGKRPDAGAGSLPSEYELLTRRCGDPEVTKLDEYSPIQIIVNGSLLNFAASHVGSVS